MGKSILILLPKYGPITISFVVNGTRLVFSVTEIVVLSKTRVAPGARPSLHTYRFLAIEKNGQRAANTKPQDFFYPAAKIIGTSAVLEFFFGSGKNKKVICTTNDDYF